MSTSLKKNRLSNMVLDFVSLVPAGDNPEAFVVISKAAPSTPTKQEDDMGDAISKDDLDPEVVAYIEGLETDNADLTKSVEDLEAAKTTLATEKADVEKRLTAAEDAGLIVKSEEDITKSLLEKADPAIRHLIAKQQADLAEVKKAADAERDVRLTKEFISKAESLPMVSEDRTALAGLLRRASEALTPEDAVALDGILKAANTQIAKGNLFSEFGHGGGETTISKSVQSAADEIKKANPTFTNEQAQAQAYAENPALLAEAMTGQDN